MYHCCLCKNIFYFFFDDHKPKFHYKKNKLISLLRGLCFFTVQLTAKNPRLGAYFHPLMTSMRDLCQERKGGSWEYLVVVRDDVVSHSGVQPIPRWCHFLSTLLSVPQPHRGALLWTPATWSDVHLGHNERWMSTHIYRRLQGCNRHQKASFPGGLQEREQTEDVMWMWLNYHIC